MAGEHAPTVQTLSSLKAKELLGWKPEYTTEDILQSLRQDLKPAAS
jgi:nucleoside-diphosphate-sugar epimerase